jgi:hypothetical protein
VEFSEMVAKLLIRHHLFPGQKTMSVNVFVSCNWVGTWKKVKKGQVESPASTAGLISVYSTYVYPFFVASIFRPKNTTILRSFHVFLWCCDLVYFVWVSTV